MTGFFAPHFLLTAAVISAVIFVNGWTDAPNAVATCIGSGAMKPRSAINMAAVFNLLGLLVMYAVNDSVARNIGESVNLGEDNRLTALCSAMIAIVVFAVAAWFFGIPTSEGHALLAALAGSAAAQGNGAGMDVGFWVSVIAGLLITSGAGFALGFLGKRLLGKTRFAEKRRFLRLGEIISAALLAFIHGAQDGQKFTAVLILGLGLAAPESRPPRLPAILYCAALMAAGTAVGGMRIIKKVGSGITTVDECGGLCCDVAAFVSLLVCTLLGMPVSTTHTKTTAVLGVGVANRRVNLRAYGAMAVIWLLTFPVCFAISFFITKLCIS